MASRSRFLIGFIAFLSIGAASALSSPDSLNPLPPKAISDLREAIVKGFGLQADDMMVSGFDIRDALVGHSVAYEFDIEIDNKVLPIKLLEDVNRWDLVDFPIFSAEEDKEEGEEKRLAEQVQRPSARVLPVLSPFMLAGPMELWIQDGDDMRLSLPHDVDAGTLKKVILSDGAALTVKGARSVILRHPLDLPLPLNRDGRPVASALLTMAETLRRLSREAPSPVLSLRIVGPTSLASSPTADKVKIKRLAPGLVELSSRSPTEDPPASLWPLTLLNGSEPNLRGFEELLSRVVEGEGTSFRLVRAEVAARTYLKMGFSVKRVLDGKMADWTGFPGWKTRPESVAAHFEVLARVEENGKVVAERIERVQPFAAEETVLASVQTGNVSMSHVPIVYPLPTPFAL